MNTPEGWTFHTTWSEPKPDLMVGQLSTYALLSEGAKLVHIVDALPTTVIGKIFKPTPIQREVESVFMDEAMAIGMQVVSAKASQDAKLGLVLRWQGKGDVAALKA